MIDRTILHALSTNAYPRRLMIAGSAIGVCGLVIADAQEAAAESAKAKTIIATRAIHHEVEFELLGQGSGTRIIFDHTGFPPELAEHLENYWVPLRKYLG